MCAKPLLSYKVTFRGSMDLAQVSFGGHYSVYHRWFHFLPFWKREFELVFCADEREPVEEQG